MHGFKNQHGKRTIFTPSPQFWLVLRDQIGSLLNRFNCPVRFLNYAVM